MSLFVSAATLQMLQDTSFFDVGCLAASNFIKYDQTHDVVAVDVDVTSDTWEDTGLGPITSGEKKFLVGSRTSTVGATFLFFVAGTAACRATCCDTLLEDDEFDDSEEKDEGAESFSSSSSNSKTGLIR